MMRSETELRAARAKLVDLMGQNHDVITKALINGMSVALQWSCDEGGFTLQSILEGHPIKKHTKEEVIAKVLEEDRVKNA